jgi:hypothetical protein
LSALALAVCSCHGATAYIREEPAVRAAEAPASIRAAQGGDTIVRARFSNVHFHVWPGVALDLTELRAEMRSTRPDGVVSFDDKRSFVLAIDTGRVGFATRDLATLMNTYVFAYRGAPLRDLSFSVDGQRLVQRGVLHKVVDIPFEMTGTVSVTAAGELRIHPTSMKICSIPGQGLMEALGVTLADLMDLSRAKGVRVAGNDLFIDPATLLPPPAISGHLVHVDLEPGALIQYFGGPRQHGATGELTPKLAAANYMYFRGGTLQFGKLFMVHADMQVIDLAPENAFDFDIGRYHEQLVGGYHRTTADDGLLVFMPDLGAIASAATASTP